MPTIEISGETLRRLQEIAEPLLDTPDSVINRLLDEVEGEPPKGRSGSKGSGGRAPRGEKTPNEKFYGPVVKVLREAGGELRTAEAVDRVGKLMATELNEVDLEALSTGEPRWRNTVRWARNDLVQKGKLDPDAPHGVWRLGNSR